MTVHLLSFASDAFRSQQKLNTLTGQKFGCDIVHACSPEDIAPEFRAAHRDLLQAPRGAGYWLWKPFLLNRLLTHADDSDWIIYCDAATAFTAPVQGLLDRMEAQALDLLIAGEGFVESRFTKRDVFVLMDCDRPEFTQTPQRFASVLVFRANEFCRRFVREWLDLACDPRLLSDQPNECGMQNYADFEDHRHDQSIFSVLSKRHGIPVSKTPFLSDDPEPRPGCVLCHYRHSRSAASVAALLLARKVLVPSDLAELD